MSQQTEQVEESTDTTESVLDAFEDWYHVPVLGAVVAFMLWVRLQSYDNFTRGGEVFFSGNDAWYHLRQVQYTVQNWPQTMPYDPWTYFPYGTSVGQFGTLYDQLVATAALIVGLGDPSQQLVAKTLLVAPAVFGALVAIPTYFIGKRLGGRPGGLFGVVVLALLPGTFLRRGLVGFADHNIAEPLFQGLAVLAMMVALTVAEREKPVYELVTDRDFESLRQPLGFSVLAGIATALYLWTWPPGVLLVGIFGVFYLLKLTADYVRGVSPDHLALVGTVSMTVTGLLMLVPLGTFDPSPTKFSILQPLLAFAVAAGCLFMAWLARVWDSRNITTWGYPAAIGGILLALTGFVYVAFRGLFDLVQNNLVRVVGFNAGAKTRTIGEAQPFLSRANPQYGINWFDVILQEYGLMLFTAGLAAVWMVWTTFRKDDHRAENMLVLVWAAFITAAAFTQIRFNYYLVVPVAVLNAYLVGRVISLASFGNWSSYKDVEGVQVIAVLFVILIVTPVLVVPASIGSTGYSSIDDTSTAVATGQNTGPGAVTEWDGTLDWMANETPEEGNYGGANNADELSYYGTFDQQNDDFSYPEGAYGVMSWWDYGHWITVQGERIPNANPFQEGARTAAKYLLAPSEQEANQVIDSLGEDQEQTRYVMVDWKMVEPSSKFGAPTVFNDEVNRYDFYTNLYQGVDSGQARLATRVKSQQYYQSQMARLYLYHGSAVDPRPIVVDYDRIGGANPDQFIKTPSNPNATVMRTFDNMSAARQFVEEDGTAQIGGVGPFPSERVPALQHYRLVKQSDSSASGSQQWVQAVRSEMALLQQAGVNPNSVVRTDPAWVKTFERVPGATVEGTGPANTTVTAQVRMSPTGKNTSFVYRQQAQTGPDGTFTMTLPYSTTGYEQWGTEQGYTNVSVKSAGQYQFFTSPEPQGNNSFVYYNATSEVSEGKVVGEDGSPVSVELTENSYNLTQPNPNNSTAPPADDAPGNNTSAPTNESSPADNSSDANGSTGVNESNASDQIDPDSALPDREDSTPARAGLVAAFVGAVAVGSRD